MDLDVTEMSMELQQQCASYTTSVNDLKGQLDEIQHLFRELGALADREKMLTMNAQNELRQLESNQTIEKDLMQLQASIQEKAIELEHAKRQLENLKQIEAKQQEYLRRLQSFS